MRSSIERYQSRVTVSNTGEGKNELTSNVVGPAEIQLTMRLKM